MSLTNFTSFLFAIGQYELLSFLSDGDAIGLRILNHELYGFFETKVVYFVKNEKFIDSNNKLNTLLPYINQSRKSIVIREIDIDNEYETNPIMIQSISSLSQSSLTSITISNCCMNYTNFDAFHTFLCSHSTVLEHLEINDVVLSFPQISQICNVDFQRLKGFCLHNPLHNIPFEESIFEKVIQKTQNTLETFCLIGFSIPSISFIYVLFPALALTTKLVWLMIDTANFSDDVIPYLCTMITNHKTLTKLSIMSNPLSDHSISMLCDSSVGLKFLDISESDFGIETTDMLIKNNHLTHLEFGHLSTSQVDMMSKVIKKNQTITKIGIGPLSSYGESDMQTIISAFLFNSTITSITYGWGNVHVNPHECSDHYFLSSLSIIITKNRQYQT